MPGELNEWPQVSLKWQDKEQVVHRKWEPQPAEKRKKGTYSAEMEIDMKKFCSLCLLLFAVSSVTAAAKGSYKNGECDGSIAECGELAAEEFSMESETSKRVLAAAHKFISPGALRRDAPVCNGGARGDPYSKSCLPPQSNRYQRGCAAYKMCRMWAAVLWVSFLLFFFG